MSVTEDMLVDKLKGHKLNMSVWQYAEASSHMDAEILYIIEHAVIHFTASLGTQVSYKIFELCTIVANIVSKTIAEREKYIHNIDTERTALIMMSAYNNLTNVTTQFKVADELLIYAINDILIQIKFNRAIYDI